MSTCLTRRHFLALCGQLVMATLLVDSTGKRIVTPGTGQTNLAALARYGASPVVAKGAPGSWEDSDVANPDVKWDAPNSRWVMNYSGYDGATWRTGLAYSNNLTTWTKEATNPVFAPTLAEGYIAANGSIVYKGTTYYLYYQAASGAGSTARIHCATSSDLLSWTRANGGSPVLSVGAGGTWDDTQTFDPFARLWPDGTIELFYGGDDGSGHRGIGRATASDGVTFTKQGKLLDPVVGDLDANFGEPSVVGNQKEYCLYHDSSRFVGYRYISRAWTENGGATFVREWAVLQPGAGGAWDSAQVFDMSPVFANGQLYLFYAGADTVGSAEGLNAQIGLATAAWPFRSALA